MPQQQVTRPLRVLVPLIKEDLQEAERAGVPYYRAAGEKLIEAKGQLNHGQWGSWLKRNFKRSIRQAQSYMALASDTQIRGAPRFSSIRDHERRTNRRPTNGNRQSTAAPPSQESARELVANKELALKLVDAGYRALAQQFHPDRQGGSHDAMSRLNTVRNRIKHWINMQ
jgi:hypothetical protein